MKAILFLILCATWASCATSATAGAKSDRRFPDGFLFGTATASYQIEGAWNDDGKSESIWDRLAHTEPCIVKECHTGDIADNSYYSYKRDVEMMRELGVDYYRFSVAWTRILPSGFANQVNELGVQYYDNLIDELLKYNIQPMITLYHWDLPQRLQDLGGWANPLMIDWFGDYARVVFERFGDRVKTFITINEPREICYQGYGDETMAPILNIKGIAEYICAKNLVLSHARAWHIYDKEFRSSQGGSTGITISFSWYEPLTDDPRDIEAAEDTIQFECGHYAHPIFTEDGDWPPVMKRRIAEKSAEQGFPRSRQPQFTQEEIEYIKGSSDFLGINTYSSSYSYRNESVNGGGPVPSFYDDLSVGGYRDPEWTPSVSSWLVSVPWGMYKLMVKLKQMYNNPIIYITENGWSTYTGLEDDDRVQYFRDYLNALLDALDEGVDVRGYTAWSLMDNFEWMQGYTERFGLYEVDYEDPARPRTPRKSAFVYKEIVKSRVIDYSYQPAAANTTMTIDEGH